MARAQDYYSLVRLATKRIFDGITELKGLQREYNALDYGNTLPDGTDINLGITKVQIGAVVFDSANALSALLDTGHATNMAKLL